LYGKLGGNGGRLFEGRNHMSRRIAGDPSDEPRGHVTGPDVDERIDTGSTHGLDRFLEAYRVGQLVTEAAGDVGSRRSRDI
jgi:hypothetical protein